MDTIVTVVVEIVPRMTIFLFAKMSILANFHRNIRGLQNELEKLHSRKTEIEEDIRLAEREGRYPTVEINGWIRNVEEIEREARQLLEEGDNASSSNEQSLRSRYKLSKRALKKRDEVKKLLTDVCKFDILIPDRRPPIIPVEKMSAPSLAGQKAAEELLKKLVAYLNDDETKRLAVWGMGGIGKTTLIVNLNNLLEFYSEAFDVVIWVTVSKDFDTRRVQSRIAERLNLEFCAGESTEGRAMKLHRTLTKKKFLLILDDVREKIDLDILGVPHGDHQPNCKILLTTRNLDVCRGMMTDVDIKMDVVNEEVAWNLFAESAGDVVNTEKIHPLARAIAKECGGLPLAIKTMGKSMRKKRVTELWEHALSQLQGSALDEEIYLPLQLSYNSLPSETHRHCFLFCALYPENNSIKTSELIQCWRADGLVDDNQTLEKSFNSGLALIESLKDSCMLEQGDRIGTVRMHNVVRDVAIRIAKQSGFFCQAGTSFTRISLIDNKITMLQSHLFRCPELTVLFLQGNPIKKIPDNFFHEVRALRVLNLSSTPIESLPGSLLHLEELRTLLLRECYYLEKLPPLGDLYELEVLDLFCTQIRELPWNMGMLSNLKELNLSHSQYLENIETGTISGLASLEALDMSFSAYKWDARHKVGKQRASFDEVLSLEQLSTLHIRLDTIDCLPLDCTWLKRLKKFNIRVSPRSCTSRYLPTQNDEKRVTLRGVDLMRRGLGGLICNATALELINCGGIKNLSEVVAGNNLKGLSGLKTLIVSSCDCIKSLINGEITLRGMLPNLEHLKVSRLHNLEMILQGIVPRGGCLSKLKTIEVVDCPRLKYLISFALLRQFQNLEEIKIGNCKRIQFLIAMGPYAVLPKLKVLQIWDMIHLRRVCTRAVDLPALERIEVKNCPWLVKLPISASNLGTIKEIKGELEWWNKVITHQVQVKRSLQRIFQARTGSTPERKDRAHELEKSSWQAWFREKLHSPVHWEH